MGEYKCVAAGELRGCDEIWKTVLNAHTEGWLLHPSPTRNSLPNQDELDLSQGSRCGPQTTFQQKQRG